ncbi:hypothetical protein TWF281_002207 [Arthrobotrys megalospora]
MADARDFFDPFWEDTSSEPVLKHHEENSKGKSEVSYSMPAWHEPPPSYETAPDSYDAPVFHEISSSKHARIISKPTVYALKPIGTSVLTIEGKGTIAVKSKATESVEFLVKTEGTLYPMLALKITKSEVVFSKKDGDDEETILKHIEVRAGGNLVTSAIAPSEGLVYWLSIDRSNRILRYGKHYISKRLTFAEVRLDDQTEVASLAPDARVAEGEWLEKLTYIETNEDGMPGSEPRIFRLPVTVDLPPLVVPNDMVSLRELDLATVTTSANLPEACQRLYQNVAGKGVALESSGFKDLALAIDKSVTTAGYWGHSKLKTKCNDPNNITDEEFQYKYLRVTIGLNLGNSPGIPYVMEVWPPGHKSVIHDHGDACAVIRVLSGKIQCTWYDALISGTDPNPLGPPVQLQKDQITWLGKNQYQVHALENTQKETCVTLQCYQFPKGDNVHVEKFRYIDVTKKTKEPFKPNSDCTFEEFCGYMEWEWKNKKPYPVQPTKKS